MATTAEKDCIIDLQPEMVEQRMKDNQVTLIDVREDFEHAAENIPGAIHLPLGKVTLENVQQICGDRPVVFHCRTGQRSADAARCIAQPGQQVFCLAGGIEAWKAQGKPVNRSASAPKLDVMRQVQITAGALVLLGVILGTLVSPWLLILSGFVGAGLMFAGLTGWCGMAMLLGKMPWNKTTPASCNLSRAHA